MLLSSPKLVLAKTTDGNVISCSNNNLDIRTKLSPISANGIFSKYNAYSNNHNHNYQKSTVDNKQSKRDIKEVISEEATVINECDKEDEKKVNDENDENDKIIKYNSTNINNNNNKNENQGISQMKKFKNPFASNSSVSSISTLELKGITNGSFTTMSISTNAFDNISTEYNQQVENSIRINHLHDNDNDTINDRKIDTILRIAKKLLGDEMLVDLMVPGSTITTTTNTTVKLYGEGDGGNTNDEFCLDDNIGDYVERVIQQELTLSSWTWRLTVRTYNTLSGVSTMAPSHRLLEGLEEEGSCRTVVIRSSRSSRSDDTRVNNAGNGGRRRKRDLLRVFRFWQRFFSTT